MGTKQILETVFNDVRLVTFIYEGREVWFASQIAQVLGYSRHDTLSTLIRTRWNGYFEEGTDFNVVSRNVLPKQLTMQEVVSCHAPAFMVLAEAGVNNVLSMTRKPIGKQLRRHLDTVVLPQFRRGMIEERPEAELIERQQEEISQLKGDLLRVQRKVIERDDKLIERDERIMQLQDEQAEWLSEAPHVRTMASSAGRSLQACKGARKLLN